MNPIAIAAGVAGLGYLGYMGYKKFMGPTVSSYQTMAGIGPGGVPLKIATPVSGSVTVAQATATPSGTLTVGQYTPIQTTIPGEGVFYAPPGTVIPATNGGFFQPPPIVITPGGAASIAIGTVKDVQHALNTLGYSNPPLAEDGKLGPLTIACIKAFQSKNKLVVDGNAGPATKAALSAALTNMAGGASVAGATVRNSNTETGMVTTSTGSTIDTTAALTMTVMSVQHILNVLGASPPLTEDGKLGPKSVAAIKSFQTAHGITPDGIAGPKTKTALYLASLQAPPQAGTMTPSALQSFFSNIS